MGYSVNNGSFFQCKEPLMKIPLMEKVYASEQGVLHWRKELPLTELIHEFQVTTCTHAESMSLWIQRNRQLLASADYSADLLNDGLIQGDSNRRGLWAESP